jgi:hypothetical protein
VKQIQLERHKTAPICPNCQGLCERTAAVTQRGDPNQFGSGLLQSLAYPVRGDCLLMLLAITAVGLVIQFASGLPGVRTVAWMLSFAAGAYALLFVREVILSATDGTSQVPPWPELDRHAALEVALLWMGTTIISFGPWLLCRFWLGTETEVLRWICHGLLAAGCLYFPMAVLAVVLNDNLSAANPVLVLVSVFRAPGRYLGLCAFAGALFGGAWLLEQALVGMPVPILALALVGAAQFYAVLAAARALGWFYYCSKEQLAWRGSPPTQQS